MENERGMKTEVIAKDYSVLPIEGGRFLVSRDLPQMVKQYGEGKKTLDYGCGPGHSTTYLKSLGLDVDGVDISKHMIENAKKLDPTGKYVTINSGEIPANDEHYDIVFAGLVLHFCSTKSELFKIIKEIARVLKPGGTFMFSVPHEEVYKRNSWLTINTDFEENKNLVSGCNIKTVIKSNNMTILHYYWTEEDYCDGVSEAGLKLVCIHKPLGKDSDGFNWVSEKEVSPIVLYIAKK